MADTPPLRAACDHGRYETHYVTTSPDVADGPTDTFDGNPCPGGREVTANEIQEMAHSLWQAKLSFFFSPASTADFMEQEGVETLDELATSIDDATGHNE